jgi:hypothetical protein
MSSSVHWPHLRRYQLIRCLLLILYITKKFTPTNIFLLTCSYATSVGPLPTYPIATSLLPKKHCEQFIGSDFHASAVPLRLPPTLAFMATLPISLFPIPSKNRAARVLPSPLAPIPPCSKGASPCARSRLPPCQPLTCPAVAAEPSLPWSSLANLPPLAISPTRYNVPPPASLYAS